MSAMSATDPERWLLANLTDADAAAQVDLTASMILIVVIVFDNIFMVIVEIDKNLACIMSLLKFNQPVNEVPRT